MLTSTRALAASLLCLAGAVAQSPALAAQWRIVNATVDQISLGQGAPAAPLLHAELPNAGAPFQDGSYQQPQGLPWMPYQYAVWGQAAPPQSGYWSDWRFYFLPSYGAAPSIDLDNMQAHFGGLMLTNAYGIYEGKSGWYVGEQPVATLGLNEGVAITQVGEGRYTASWSVRSTWGTFNQDDPAYPLYSVNLTFVAFPEGTPWSYAPVPEPSSVFMALVGIGAVGVIRRRQARRPAAG
jgi:hypothetical protein